MKETTMKNGEVVEFSTTTGNATNSIKVAPVKKVSAEEITNNLNKVIDIGSKLSTDKIKIVKKDAISIFSLHIIIFIFVMMATM